MLINDGSKDGSQKIIDRYVKQDSRVKSFKKKNGGQSAARNFGVKQSTGRYLAFLDQDDRYLPAKLQKTVAYLEYKPEYDVVYTDLDIIDRDGYIMTVSALTSSVPPLPQVHHPKRSIFDCLSGDMFILPGASVLHREIFEKVGGYDERLSGYEEDDLFLRIFMSGRIAFLKEPLLQWRLYGESYSYSPRMEKSCLIYFHKLLETFPDTPRHNVHWRRDVLLPRFCNSYVMELYNARQSRDKQRYNLLRQDFETIPDKPWGVRVQLFLLSPWIPLFVLHFARKVYRFTHR